MNTVYIRCARCGGRGRVALTGEYASTMDFLRTCAKSLGDGFEVTGAELAPMLDIKPTAANNRLAILEKHGLLASRRFGRKRLYRIKGVAC